MNKGLFKIEPLFNVKGNLQRINFKQKYSKISHSCVFEGFHW